MSEDIEHNEVVKLKPKSKRRVKLHLIRECKHECKETDRFGCYCYDCKICNKNEPFEKHKNHNLIWNFYCRDCEVDLDIDGDDFA